MSDVESIGLEEKWEEFYREYYKNEMASVVEKGELDVGYTDLLQFDPDLADILVDEADKAIEKAETALRNLELAVEISDDSKIRISNFSPKTKIRGLRSDDINHLISVEGIVRKATDVRPKVVEAVFECQRCGGETVIEQSGEFKDPYQCVSCERKGPFELLEDKSRFVDSQKLQVQESPEGLRGGETPKNVDVTLEGGITGEVAPGDRVTATGILRATPGKNSTTFEVYIEGNNVEVEERDFEEFEIADQDIQKIEELARSQDIYEKMIDSIAPSIHGYRQEKMAMALQLFSGVTKTLPDTSRVRGDIHILLVGDPGTAKSQLLQYVREIAPRGIYTTGKGSTSAGLTAAAVKDEFGDGKWTLEAGALVLADNGVACVDEIDKMDSKDRSALHESLEQQQVSVAKAGINATLKSRCSLLAAANPKYGRFDEYEGIAEQINLEPALLSRFDLIFTTEDEPDEEEDSRLAQHILKTNYAGEMAAREEDNEKQEIEAVEPEIPPELLRKYVAYARRNCSPKMTDEARKEIEDFYVDLRTSGAEDAVPVTARKLEALVRLAEASARIRLSQKVETRDAKRAIKVTKSSLENVSRDPETGELDVDVIESGHSHSQRERMNLIRDLVKDVTKEHGQGKAPIKDVLEKAEQEGLDPEKTEKDIDSLKRRGDLIQPEQGYLRLV